MEAKREDNINIDYIEQAGKALKTIVFIVLIIILLPLIGFFVAYSSSYNVDTIKQTLWIVGFISIILVCIVLIKFYQAGDNLENAKSIKQVSESGKPNTENEISLKTIKFLKYSTDKGIVEIAPGTAANINALSGACISLRGQKAFLNGQPATNGKYNYGFMKNFHIENGIVIKG